MKGLKLLFLSIISHLIIFLGLYNYFYGVSGGDIGLVMFTIISFIFYVLIWWIISIRWSWKDRLYILSGIILTAIIEIITINLIM